MNPGDDLAGGVGLNRDKERIRGRVAVERWPNRYDVRGQKLLRSSGLAHCQVPRSAGHVDDKSHTVAHEILQFGTRLDVHVGVG